MGKKTKVMCSLRFWSAVVVVAILVGLLITAATGALPSLPEMVAHLGDLEDLIND